MATKVKLIADNAITTTQIDTSSLDSHFSGGTGVTYSSGEISIGQAVHSTDSPTFADLTLTGNLNITGDLNSYNVTDLDVTDQTITLGAGQTEELSGGSGIIVDGSGASILWDETTDGWVFNKQIAVNADDCTTASSLSNIVVGEYADTSSGIVLRGTTASALNFEDNSSVTAARVYYNHASGYMAFNTEQTERLRIDSSGNVGIGITNAAAKIGKGNGYAGNTSATASGYLDLYNGNDGNTYLYNTGAFALKFGTNNTERMRIDSSGNVGIGTNNPSGEFHVYSGLAHNQCYITTGSTGGTGYDASLTIAGGANNSEMELRMGIVGNETRDRIKTYQGAMYFRTNSAERMVIDSSGRVTTPQQPHILFSPRYSGGSGFANTHNENTSYSRGTLSTTVVGGYARITVPVAGLYLVTFNSICDTSTGRQDTAIAVNGGNVVTGLSEDNGQGYHYRSHAVTLDLAANDYLTFSNDDWYDAAQNSYTTWRNVSVTLIG